MDDVQAANVVMELQVLEAEARNSKECEECGEPLQHDQIGQVCPGCGHSIYDGIHKSSDFMSLVTVGIADPTTARSSRVVH